MKYTNKEKIIENKFSWVPCEKRVSRFGGPMPPRKAEMRQPVLWLTRDREELYLVNASDEVLDVVIANNGRFQTIDDDIQIMADTSNYHYENVEPNSAVKVEEYDGFYDLDYLSQVSIVIKSESLGYINLLSPVEKGGIDEIVLLWDNGETGKYVKINRYEQGQN